MVLQEDPQNNSSSKPDWVSYFVQDPSSKQWVHTTLFSVPAGTTVHMTILGYDGCTPPRNNFWSQVQGTIGGTVNLSIVNNKGVATPPRDVSVINGWAGCTVGHTFAIPALHLFIPVASPNALDSANNLCGVSPCTSGPACGGDIQLQGAQPRRHLPLAVLRPVRRRLHRRQRRPDADHRLHDRQHGGKSLMATPEAPAASAPAERRHGLWIFVIWLPLAVIADMLIWFVWQPHLPPGTMTTSAQHQQFDIAVMAVVGAPVLLFVWTYAAYALFSWRHREGDEEDGPPIHGNARIQATWIGATAVIVLGLFVFGTVELIVPAGAGAGRGPRADLDAQHLAHARGAGDRPAVGLHLPLPAVRRHGEQRSWCCRPTRRWSSTSPRWT